MVRVEDYVHRICIGLGKSDIKAAFPAYA